jgi:hypothetical protein
MTPRGMIFRAVCMISLTFLLFACGGGGGDSTQAPIIVNPSGYPDVAGTYSMNIKSTAVTCSDGSATTVDAMAKNFTVTQNINQINLAGTSTPIPLPSNITVVSKSDLSGNVDPAGNFIVNGTVVAQIGSVPGQTSYSYNFTGAFTSSGWSGYLKYSVLNATIPVSCTGTTTFTGERISKSTVQSVKSAQAEEDRTPIEVHSIFDAASMLLVLDADGSDNR